MSEIKRIYIFRNVHSKSSGEKIVYNFFVAYLSDEGWYWPVSLSFGFSTDTEINSNISVIDRHVFDIKAVGGVYPVLNFPFDA